ncbi:MAG: hypothetical protein FWE61_05175, partial [Micrococcales bacterium]|nr:hypothetical protein [Micrococcales bacterium]
MGGMSYPSYPPYPSPLDPFAPPPRRRAGLVWLVAVAVVVVLVVTGFVVVAVRSTPRPAASPPSAPTRTGTAATSWVPPCDEQDEDRVTGPHTGNASAGDPYLCWAGGLGYDALSYDVAVRVNPTTAHISGHAEVVVRLTEAVDAVHLDLLLPASAVTVDGTPARFVHDGLDLAVDVDARVGEEVTIGVDYAGVPSIESIMGNAVHHEGNELLLADQPVGAVTWVPMNAHPSDPALFRAEVSVPAGMEAISVGRLVSHGPDPGAPGRDLWVWEPDEPVIGYTVMLAVGHYVLDGPREVKVGGRTVQYLAAAPASHADPQATLDWLGLSVRAADELTRFAGDYPLSSLGGLVPPMYVPWALETHGRPVYTSGFMDQGEDRVITHELAHFWFGDTVTLAAQRDIVINEGLAS